MQDEEARYRGVNGYLLLFCLLNTILAPIVYLGQVGRTDDPFVWVISIILAALAVTAGVSVWRTSTHALRIVKIYFISLLCLHTLALLGSLGQLALHEKANTTVLLSTSGRLVVLFAWWMYFKKSRRVRWTLDGNL